MKDAVYDAVQLDDEDDDDDKQMHDEETIQLQNGTQLTLEKNENMTTSDKNKRSKGMWTNIIREFFFFVRS